jgi:hypothetical protein
MYASLAAKAATVPGYCTSGTGVRTPAQWATCAKLGWNQPTTTAAHAGLTVGHYAAPVLVILAVIVLILAVSRSGSRSPATQRS